MGFQSAANAQAQGTQQGMMFQAAAAQQQQQALEQARQQAADALRQGQTQGAGALQAGQTGALQALPQYYQEGVGYQQPYMQAGTQATNQLAQLFGPGGAYTQQPTLEQLQMDPSYAFRLQQGQQAMMNAARAGGLAGSGGALKAATRYGQEAGSQEYSNAYNRFMANRLAATQGLQNLSGQGAGAANIASGLAGTTGANVANVYRGTAGDLANVYGNTAANLASTYTGAGNQLAGVYGGLGQGLAQGAANIGSIYAQSAMAPTNALSAALGSAAQAGAAALGGRYARTGSIY